jgi:hypothetical protein
MMTLPNPLQESLDLKIQQFEEQRTMPLLSNMELRGIERTARTAIKTVLQARFGSVTSDIEDFLSQISDLPTLEKILTIAATVNSPDDFWQSLEEIQSTI